MPQPMSAAITIADYDPRWPLLFAEERERIEGAIGQRIADIQHVGSTAVPGLASKPLIDIIVAVRSISDADGCIAPLEALGYTYRGEVVFDGGRYYKKIREDGERTHSTHLCEASNPEWTRHILFRDYLRNHPTIALQYADLKRLLSAKFVDDWLGYTNAKSEFIEACIAKASLEPRYDVRIVDYDPRWPEMYEEEKARILEAIGEWLLTIQHVGSTAVPGLAAKPIIDIMPGLRDLAHAERCIAPLEALGYEYVPQYNVLIPERRYFQKGYPRTHHMHMVEVGKPLWQRHVAFRDYLRMHLDVAREYAALKRELAVRYRDDRFAYTEAKSEFIRGTEGEALAAQASAVGDKA